MNIESILTHYDEPHRHYHNRKHIEYMFRIARENGLSHEIDQQGLLWYAIVYHDIIYIVGNTNNEELSAKLFLDIELSPNGSFKQRLYNETSHREIWIFHSILATKDHLKNNYCLLDLLDLDLAILGDTWEVYEEYSANVRKEYSHLTDEEWRRGRSKWLDSMLSRDFIYYTDWGKKREQKAKDNLFQELQHIRLTNLAIRNINERSS